MTNKPQPNLRLPGPVPLSDEVRKIVGSQMFNHRGPEYAVLLEKMTRNFKTVMLTHQDAYFITSSGTGGMEASIVNTLSPGDTVLVISIGWFGHRFGDIAEAYGMRVVWLKFNQGEAADPDLISRELHKHPEVKAVLLTHNESSTGVANPLAEICARVHDASDALILVDAVSSAGATLIETDNWDIDVVATASQKAWGTPPGVTMVTFSQKAWDAYGHANCPKYYLDLKMYEDYLNIGQPPFTPCIPTMLALEYTLDSIMAEGRENVITRHHKTAQQVRDRIDSLGLRILPDKEFASDTTTAVRLPQDVDGKQFLSKARTEYNVIFGGGQGDLAGKIFRIGHMGWVQEAELQNAIKVAHLIIEKLR